MSKGVSLSGIAVFVFLCCSVTPGFSQTTHSYNTFVVSDLESHLQVVSSLPQELGLRPVAAVLLHEPLTYQQSQQDNKKKKGGGTTVPEGGSTRLYLGFAASACLAAALLSRWRKKDAESVVRSIAS